MQTRANVSAEWDYETAMVAHVEKCESNMALCELSGFKLRAVRITETCNQLPVQPRQDWVVRDTFLNDVAKCVGVDQMRAFQRGYNQQETVHIHLNHVVAVDGLL